MGVRGRDFYEKQRELIRQEAIEANKRYKERQRKMRKTFTKKERQAVYEKYHGHCAYCGKEIALNEMQVDHIVPVMHALYGTKEQREPVEQMITDGSMNSLDNLNPSCRACNFYKGMSDVEGFRQRILTQLDHTCRSSFQTKLAMQYGMITYTPWNGKFYFETLEGKEK